MAAVRVMSDKSAVRQAAQQVAEKVRLESVARKCGLKVWQEWATRKDKQWQN